MRNHRFPLFAALCGAGLLAVAIATSASGAGGGGELKYASQSNAVPNQDIGRARGAADCPQSHPHPTGGGVETSGGNQGNLDVEVAATSPSNNEAGWVTQVNNNSGSGAHMTTTAVCAKGKFVYESAARTIRGNNQAQKEVFCPHGTHLTGGGVNTGSLLPQVEVASSEPIDGPDPDKKRDDGWLGIGNNGRPGDVAMTVHAVCAKSGSYRYVESSRSNLPDNSQRSDSATCPKGTEVTGGGVDITGIDDGIEVAGSFPSDGGDPGFTPDNGWDGVANNDSTGRAEQMQVFAICQE